MADIELDGKGTSMPAGIPTWNLVYKAIDKLIKRVNALEKKEDFRADFKNELEKIWVILNRYTEELEKETKKVKK